MLNWDYWKSSLCRWQLKTFRLLCCYTVKHVHRGVSLDRIAFICRVLLDCFWSYCLHLQGLVGLVLIVLPSSAGSCWTAFDRIAFICRALLDCFWSYCLHLQGLVGLLLIVLPSSAGSCWTAFDRIAFICRVLLDCLTLETEGTMQLVPGVRGAIRLTRYKPEDSGFNPHCSYWDNSFTYSLRTHCDSGIDSEKSTSNICWGKGGRCCRADNLPNFMCQLSRTSGSLNFPEPQKFGVTLHM